MNVSVTFFMILQIASFYLLEYHKIFNLKKWHNLHTGVFFINFQNVFHDELETRKFIAEINKSV